MTERSLKILQELSDAPGASGFEDEVVAAIRPYVAISISTARKTGATDP